MTQVSAANGAASLLEPAPWNGKLFRGEWGPATGEFPGEVEESKPADVNPVASRAQGAQRELQPSR